MVSSKVILIIAALAQAAVGSCIPAPPCVRYEQGCCPGQVVEEKIVVNKPCVETYVYQEPTISEKCYQKPCGVDKKVVPKVYETKPICQTQETKIKVPFTDIETDEQPLVKKTCTTSEYIIQIPIVETTCTNSPLCKKSIRKQDSVLNTVSRKTSCNKEVCSQTKVVETPITETVCQKYQGSINKVGTKTVNKPEVIKKCVQLPPYKCLKPVTSPAVDTPYYYSPYNAAAAAAEVSAIADASYLTLPPTPATSLYVPPSPPSPCVYPPAPCPCSY